jgi:hypothetical protein
MMEELRLSQFRYLAEVYEMSEQQINWAEMRNEDLRTQSIELKNKYEIQQVERVGLLKTKLRCEELEILIKEAGETLH